MLESLFEYKQWHGRAGALTVPPAIQHPGHDGRDGRSIIPQRLWNTDPDYEADAPGLMGLRSIMRPEYFDIWINYLNQEYTKCGTHHAF
jgi:hypothetical protein